MATPKLAVAASKGTLPGPDDDGSDENFIYGGPENADGPAAARPECTNNLKQLGIAIHALDAGDPSSFQINSADADDMERSFDLVFPTQTAYEQREGNAVATESLEIAHEGFLHGRDDGWTHLVKIDLTEPTALQRVHTPGALLFSFSSEPTCPANAMAESGGNTDAHAPHAEDSWGLWQIDVDPAGASADLWEWRKQVMDGTIKDTLDFQPQLTSEPTAAEGGHVQAFSGHDTSLPTAPAGDDGSIPAESLSLYFDKVPLPPAPSNDGGEPKQMFAQILQQMTQGGSPPDAFDFTSEPTAPMEVEGGETYKPLVCVFLATAPAGGDGSIDDLAVDPNNPNADLRDGEYVVTGLQHVSTDTSSATGDSYAGPHALYDLFMP